MDSALSSRRPGRLAARPRLESMLAFLAVAKNVPLHARDLTALAEAVLGRADEPMLRLMLAGEFNRSLLDGLDDSLDWIAARNIVRLFAHAARLKLGASELQPLIVRFQAEAKSYQARQGLALRWPDGRALEIAAFEGVRSSAPVNAEELQAALADSLRTLELEWFEPALDGGVSVVNLGTSRR